MSFKEQINPDLLPKHIAIIMDGNGRWAQNLGKDRIYGHKNGVTAVRETTEAAAEIGISFLTLYAFSSENWKRPRIEVEALMSLLLRTIHKEIKTLNDNNIKLLAIGDLESLNKSTLKALNHAIEDTSTNNGMTLILALSYSSQNEILSATRQIAEKIKNDLIGINEIDHDLFRNHLSTSQFPDPELLIRTSGEYRISNFLLYQLAYAELYFTKKLWPDFRKEDFYEALVNYQCRERRFGRTSDQLKTNCQKPRI